jgi:hypothetical protein
VYGEQKWDGVVPARRVVQNEAEGDIIKFVSETVIAATLSGKPVRK